MAQLQSHKGVFYLAASLERILTIDHQVHRGKILPNWLSACKQDEKTLDLGLIGHEENVMFDRNLLWVSCGCFGRKGAKGLSERRNSRYRNLAFIPFYFVLLASRVPFGKEKFLFLLLGELNCATRFLLFLVFLIRVYSACSWVGPPLHSLTNY